MSGEKKCKNKQQPTCEPTPHYACSLGTPASPPRPYSASSGVSTSSSLASWLSNSTLFTQLTFPQLFSGILFSLGLPPKILISSCAQLSDTRNPDPNQEKCALQCPPQQTGGATHNSPKTLLSQHHQASKPFLTSCCSSESGAPTEEELFAHIQTRSRHIPVPSWVSLLSPTRFLSFFIFNGSKRLFLFFKSTFTDFEFENI